MLASGSIDEEGGFVLTIFEYLSVAVSIILSISMAQLLGGLRQVAAPGRRYWVHCVWYAQSFLAHILQWWSFWALRNVSSWNIAAFALVLLPSILLLLSVNALVSESPADIECWRDYFFRVRPWFFTFKLLIPVAGNLILFLLLDRPLNIAASLSIVLLAVAAFSKSRRVHGILAVAYFVAFLAFPVARRFELGSM